MGCIRLAVSPVRKDVVMADPVSLDMLLVVHHLIVLYNRHEFLHLETHSRYQRKSLIGFKDILQCRYKFDFLRFKLSVVLNLGVDNESC